MSNINSVSLFWLTRDHNVFRISDKDLHGPYKQALIPSFQAYLLPMPFGKLLVQRKLLMSNTMQLWAHNFFVEKQTEVNFLLRTSHHFLHYGLKNDWQISISELGKQRLKEGRCAFLKLGGSIQHSMLLEQGETGFFSIDISSILLNSVKNYSPDLKGQLERSRDHFGSMFGQRKIKREESRILEEIKGCPDDIEMPVLRNISFELLLCFFKDIRGLSLDRLTKVFEFRKVGNAKFSINGMEAIRKYVQNNLEKDINTHFLKEKFGIDTNTFGKDFLKQYGCHYYTYINNLRIKVVEDEYNLTEMDIKAIAKKMNCGIKFIYKLLINVVKSQQKLSS